MFRRVISQTVAVRARTFSATPVVRAGAYTAFIQQVYRNRAQKAILKKLPFTQKAKQISQWYKALSTAEMQKLTAAGKKINCKVPKRSNKRKIKKNNNRYSKFVKAQMKTKDIKALPVKSRLGAIAKIWKQAKQ